MRRAQLLLLLFALPHCAHVERESDRTWVEVDGHWVIAQDTRRGCEGESVDHTKHRQLGGSVAIEHQARSGFTAGGRVSLGSGVITRTTLEDADYSHYLLGSVGAWGGYDFRYWGVQGGINLLFTTGPLDEGIVLPWILTRLGTLDDAWFEAAAGPRDGIFDGRFLRLGTGFRFDRFSGRAGFAFIARAIRDPYDDGRGLDLAADARVFDPGGYVEASFDLTPSWSVGLGAQLSVAPSAWLALRFTLPSWADEDPLPAR